MKKYRVTFKWTMRGSVEVEAKHANEAIRKAENEFYGTKNFPEDAEYVQDSFEAVHVKKNIIFMEV